MSSINLTYQSIQSAISSYAVQGRTESAAFLHWFLVNIYRLDLLTVQDIVCDNKGDKGIDAIYINQGDSSIDIFQCKLSTKDERTLGDTSLKEFWGSLAQLQKEDTINTLISSNSNSQLKHLLENNKDALISGDYTLRGVFITNMRKDGNAESFLNLISQITPETSIDVWDRDRIEQNYVPSDQEIHATVTTQLRTNGGFLEYKTDSGARVLITSVPALDLVNMQGIAGQQIFDLNLRRGLGKTKVNKDIIKSISAPDEHSNFLLYHNGITILCESATITNFNDHQENNNDENPVTQSANGTAIDISSYAVVNGCQSLTCLYNNKAYLSENLQILTRIIEIKNSPDLVARITYNSNNQNGIKARDFRSNTATQVRLQKEFEQDYPDFFYQVKTGDKPSKGQVIIDNELAGQLLLVFDLGETHIVQRKSDIFDELHQKIFSRPQVNAGRIISIYKIFQIIEPLVSNIKPELFSSYQITKFFLLHLFVKALQSEAEQNFLKAPEKFLIDAPDKEAKYRHAIETVLTDLIQDLNDEFRDQGGESYDFKQAFKSSSDLAKLSNAVVNSYIKFLNRGRADSFTQMISD